MQWKRFVHFWKTLVWWEKEILLWYAHVAFGKRAVFPAVTVQALAMGLIALMMPGEILLWSFVFVVSMVYALMVQVWLTRL